MRFDDLEGVEEADRDIDAETREDIVRYRTDLGLPVDEATVEWFLAAWKADQHDGGMWFTEAEEEEHFRLQALAEEARDAALDYVAKHGADHAGSWYGRGDYHVAFARNAEAHREALMRLVPRPEALHVHAHEYTAAELEAISERIPDEADELRAEGVIWMSSGVDVEANRVAIEVAAPDEATATSILTRRYGPAVTCEWRGRADTVVKEAPWQLWTLDESKRLLTVHYSTWADAELERAECRADECQVTVAVFVRLRGTMRAIAKHFEATVELEEPLGERRVIDAATGRPRERRVPRDVLERTWELVRDYGARHPGEFGGTWAEHPGCHVAFTANVDAHRAALVEALPEPRVLVVHRAERALAELEAMEKRIAGERRLLRSHGIDCDFVTIHVDDNAVFMEIDAEDDDAARRFLAARYGPGINVMS